MKQALLIQHLIVMQVKNGFLSIKEENIENGMETESMLSIGKMMDLKLTILRIRKAN